MHPKDYSFIIKGIPLAVREDAVVLIRTPEQMYKLCEDLATLPQECLVVICLNSKGFVIDRHAVTIGLMDSCLIHPREVFRCAIYDNAAVIVLCHNHPSGDYCPSAEDIRVTKKLIEAGKIVDIKVLDHVIIGKKKTENDKGFLSMRESGLCEFN